MLLVCLQGYSVNGVRVQSATQDLYFGFHIYNELTSSLIQQRAALLGSLMLSERQTPKIM